MNKNTLKLIVLGCSGIALSMSQTALALSTSVPATPAADPDGLNPVNLVTAQTQCAAAAALLDADGPAAQSDRYTGTVVETAPTYVSGPTEVGGEGARTIVGEKVGAGTFTPAHLEILGDPYRNGGSVNMFGMQQSVGGHYSNSSYDFTAPFNTTYNVAYTCNVSMENYVAEVRIPHKVEGHYINCDFGHGQGNDNDNSCTDVGQPQGSCEAHNNTGDSLPFWGQDTEQCKFIVTKAAYVEIIPEHWEDPVDVATGIPGGSFNQTQTDTLGAHESMGAGFDTGETLLIGQVVVCISPSKTGTKLPGAWATKNGYTGTKCNSAWYNGTTPYSLSNYAGTSTPNLNDGSHNWVTVPVI